MRTGKAPGANATGASHGGNAAMLAQLPPGLVRSERQPADPSEVVKIWFIPLASWPSKSYQAGGVIGLIEPPIAEVTHANCYFCSRVNAGSGACCLRPNGSRELR
jgi:hypothetical protein